MGTEFGHSQASVQGSLTPTSLQPQGSERSTGAAQLQVQDMRQEGSPGADPLNPVRLGRRSHVPPSLALPLVQHMDFSFSFSKLCFVGLSLLSQNTS